MDSLIGAQVGKFLDRTNGRITQSVGKMESEFQIMGMLNDASRKVLLGTSEAWLMSPAQVASMNQASPAFGQICAISGGGQKAACKLANLLSARSTGGHINVFLSRQGAKSH